MSYCIANLQTLHFKYRIFRALPIQKMSKFVKNKHARYTFEYFLVDNARYLYKMSKFVKNEHAWYSLER
jgi:hypothetical protein